MDITTVTSYRFASSRGDLALAPGEKILAGGTWLMSEPQSEVTGFVDITRMGWSEIEVTDAGLRVAATCTIARFVAWSRGELDTPVPAGWHATGAIPDAAHALLMSFKVWNTATVGGNVCQSFTAAAMVSLLARRLGSVQAALVEPPACLGDLPPGALGAHLFGLCQDAACGIGVASNGRQDQAQSKPAELEDR